MKESGILTEVFPLVKNKEKVSIAISKPKTALLQEGENDVGERD
jgi:hypothetical protein